MSTAAGNSALHSIQRYIITGGILVALVTFGIGGWASTTELSGAVVAQGSIVVDFSVKKVQHPTGGVVSELRVKEGDRVKAGDILVRLDETQTLANATIIIKSFDELQARQARLEAERDGADQIVFPGVLPRASQGYEVRGGTRDCRGAQPIRSAAHGAPRTEGSAQGT